MMLMRKIHGGVGEANSRDEAKSEASSDDGDPEDESDDKDKEPAPASVIINTHIHMQQQTQRRELFRVWFQTTHFTFYMSETPQDFNSKSDL